MATGPLRMWLCRPRYSTGQIEALALALAEVSALGDPVLTRVASSVLAKVAAILPDTRPFKVAEACTNVGHSFSLWWRTQINAVSHALACFCIEPMPSGACVR